MCRVLAYLGEPISLGHVLYETDSSLVRQSYSPRMMETFLNLAGFGVVAWDPHSVRARDPFAGRRRFRCSIATSATWPPSSLRHA
jgi:predicted glutamine amidotransferase